MRIISGVYRGKKLVSAPEEITRPTLDRAKESLFNILEHMLCQEERVWSDILFADVFAGSGAIGIEALSRGAGKALFFEKNPIAVQFLKRNLDGLKNVTAQIYGDAFKAPVVTTPADIVFMDAPYHQGLIEQVLPIFYQTGWFGERTIIVLEIDSDETLQLPVFLTTIRVVKYGRNQFIFARLKEEK